MKALGVISTTALFLLLGYAVPAFAQEEHHEQEAKPEKQQEEAKPERQQEQAKPAKQQEEAKPAKQQEQAKTEKRQEQAKPAKQQEEARPAKQQEQAKTERQQQEQAKPEKQEDRKQADAHAQKSQGQWAHDGQKDSHGHVYSESRFGRDHHARFVATGGRMYNGRREYSYGGYWFYAGAYPGWFYQQDVYFVMGADGLWYAVAYNDPSLTFEVQIG